MIKIKKTVSLFLAIFLLFSLPVSASEMYNDLQLEERVSSRANLFLSKFAWTQDGKGDIEIGATVVVSDSVWKIIGVQGAYVSSNDKNYQNINLGSPIIWNNGSYATITLTYIKNGNVTTDVVKFYP